MYMISARERKGKMRTFSPTQSRKILMRVYASWHRQAPSALRDVAEIVASSRTGNPTKLGGKLSCVAMPNPKCPHRLVFPKESDYKFIGFRLRVGVTPKPTLARVHCKRELTDILRHDDSSRSAGLRPPCTSLTPDLATRSA